MTILIKELPDYEKPRERFVRVGASNMSNEELLAIILRCGTKSISSKELGTIILSKYNGIEGLKNTTVNSLTNIKGIGISKAILILSALELGKRVYYQKERKDINFNNTTSIYEYFKGLLLEEKQEYFYVLFLDNKNKLISIELLFKGTLNQTTIHPREIFKRAFMLSAASIILVHNHPSGDVSPSVQDIDITNQINEISIMMGIKLLDHIIISNSSYYSFYEKMNKK